MYLAYLLEIKFSLEDNSLFWRITSNGQGADFIPMGGLCWDVAHGLKMAINSICDDREELASHAALTLSDSSFREVAFSIVTKKIAKV